MTAPNPSVADVLGRAADRLSELTSPQLWALTHCRLDQWSVAPWRENSPSRATREMNGLVAEGLALSSLDIRGDQIFLLTASGASLRATAAGAAK